MGSTRLPGKVLMPIAGRPLLGFMLDRLAAAREIDEIVVATSDGTIDDPIVALAESAAVPVVRGSEADVLGRFALALRDRHADHVVRLTADCPLIDPAIVDLVVLEHLRQDADYTSNTLLRTYPDGLDVEVLRSETLLAAHARASSPGEREHVTPYVYRRPDTYRLAAHVGPRDLEDERWTVDTPDDFRRVTAIAESKGPATPWEALFDSFGPRAPEMSITLRVARNQGSIDSACECAGEPRGSIAPPLLPGRRTWLVLVDGQPRGAVTVKVDGGIGDLAIVVDPALSGRMGELLCAVDHRLAADSQVVELVIPATDDRSIDEAAAAAGFGRENAGWRRVRLP